MHQHASNGASEHSSGFWPLLHSSIICKVWLTVINTWFLLPSEGGQSNFFHFKSRAGGKWSLYFLPQWSYFLFFYKSVSVETCEAIPSIHSPRLAYKVQRLTIQSITHLPSRLFMYVSGYNCLSTATRVDVERDCDLLCGQTWPNCLWSMEEGEKKKPHKAVTAAALLAQGSTHTSLPPAKPVSHSPLSSSNGAVTERPHAAGEHGSV